MAHPQKLLEDAVAMYHGRVSIALDERRERQRWTGMFVVMGEHARIVTDMRVLCLDAEELLARVDPSHPTVRGAMATLHAREEAVPFGVLLADGGVMMTTLAVHDADRDRRD